MDVTLFTELVKQAPSIGAILLLVHVFLRFITEERKARDIKDAATMAIIDRLEERDDSRAKDCHRTQAEATAAMHRVAGVIERLPQHFKES